MQSALVSVAIPEVAIRGRLVQAAGHWSNILMAVYAVVTFVLLLRLAISFGRAWKLWAHSSPVHEDWTRAADVRIAAGLVTPVTFGSTVLLPPQHTDWSEAKRLAVLAHEQAHARAFDCQVQWLAGLHVCLFWFSPLSWWLRRHLAELAEHSSDDAVIRGNADRAGYAAVLLEAAQSLVIGRTTLVGPRVAVSIASGNVARRIDRVLSGREPADLPSPWRRAMAIALLVPAVVLCAAQAQNAGFATDRIGMDSLQPRIVATGGLGELSHWYPRDPMSKGIEGLVQIAVSLDSVGRATDTLVLSEFPQGLGFGAAASGLVHGFTYANPTGHPATLTFNVKFALQAPTTGTTNFESGEQATP
jgi:hypothetical protein